MPAKRSAAVAEQAPSGQGLAGIKLDAIVLWESSVERGTADTISIGQIDGKVSIDPRGADDGSLAYLVRGDYAFENEDGEHMLSISMTFLLNYSTPWDEAPPEDVVESFARSVTMQVVPFQREFLATMTNRLGMPPFFLPLMRQSQIAFTSDKPGSDTHS